MIERKLILLKKGHLTTGDKFPIEIIDSKDVKAVVRKKVRIFIHIALIIIFRVYIRGTNILKEYYQKFKNFIMIYVFRDKRDGENREVSGFLKMMSEYKQKVRKIKHRIHEEERENNRPEN